jgi:hypothetical protein
MNTTRSPMVFVALLFLGVYTICYLLASRSLRGVGIGDAAKSGLLTFWKTYFEQAPSRGWSRWTLYLAIVSFALTICLLTSWALARPHGKRTQRGQPQSMNFVLPGPVQVTLSSLRISADDRTPTTSL